MRSSADFFILFPLYAIFIFFFFFFFNDTATTEIYTLSLHDALPTCSGLVTTPPGRPQEVVSDLAQRLPTISRSEEHTSELQSQSNLVCRLLLEKKKKNPNISIIQKKKKKKQ